MSVLFKAKGSPSFSLFLIRLVAGIYMLILGISQASNVESYIGKIKAMNILSPNTAFIVGFIEPFLLILLASLYIMGFFTPISSFMLALLTFVKLIAHGLFATPGIPFSKDVLFLACFIATLFAGAGMISFDALLDKSKKPKAITPVPSTPPSNEEPNKQIVHAEIITEPQKDVNTENK